MPFLKNPLKRIKDLTHFPSTSSADSTTPSKTEGIDINSQSRASSNTKNYLLKKSTFNNSEESLRDISNKKRFKELEEANTHKTVEDVITRALDFSQDKKPASENILKERESIKDEAVECERLYRPLSMNMSKSWNRETRIFFKDIDFKSKSFSSLPLL